MYGVRLRKRGDSQERTTVELGKFLEIDSVRELQSTSPVPARRSVSKTRTPCSKGEVNVLDSVVKRVCHYEALKELPGMAFSFP